jgi:hypothetical protein
MPHQSSGPVTISKYASKIMKLHGSINWLYCPNCSRLYVHRYKNIGINYADVCPHCPVNEDQKILLEEMILTPTMLKELQNHHLGLTWQHAFMELNQADKVVFIGYSLPLADFELRYFWHRIGTTLLNRVTFPSTRHLPWIFFKKLLHFRNSGTTSLPSIVFNPGNLYFKRSGSENRNISAIIDVEHISGTVLLLKEAQIINILIERDYLFKSEVAKDKKGAVPYFIALFLILVLLLLFHRDFPVNFILYPLYPFFLLLESRYNLAWEGAVNSLKTAARLFYFAG